MTPQAFQERWQALQEQIAAAAARAGRNPDEITLVSVSKTHPAATIQLAYDAGVRDFGENRVAELLDKQAALTLPDARWHFIGHIQSRKAKELVGHSALIQSVDRLSLAEELSKRSASVGLVTDGLLQVNASGEESKGGWEVSDAEGRAAFFREVETMLALPALRLHGLMTLAPFYEEAERTRPTFAAVRALQHALRQRFPAQPWATLSMGMSNDFNVAIEEGATHIRVGTALFGERHL